MCHGRASPGATPPIHGETSKSRVSKLKRLPAAKLTHGETVPYLDAFLLGAKSTLFPMKEPCFFQIIVASFLCPSAMFQKLAVAQRAGARLSLMGGEGGE